MIVGKWYCFSIELFCVTFTLLNYIVLKESTYLYCQSSTHPSANDRCSHTTNPSMHGPITTANINNGSCINLFLSEDGGCYSHSFISFMKIVTLQLGSW